MRKVVQAALAVFTGALCYAQEFDQTRVTVTFKDDGAVEARVAMDVDALLADQPYRELTEKDYAELRALSAEEFAKRLDEIRAYLRARVLLKFDGEPIETTVVFPECETKEGKAPGDLPGDYFVVRGEVPPDAESFTFTASPVFFNMFLLVRVEGEEKGVREVLPPGGESQPFTGFREAVD
jgi:hypothetical protein